MLRSLTKTWGWRGCGSAKHHRAIHPDRGSPADSDALGGIESRVGGHPCGLLRQGALRDATLAGRTPDGRDALTADLRALGLHVVDSDALFLLVRDRPLREIEGVGSGCRGDTFPGWIPIGLGCVPEPAGLVRSTRWARRWNERSCRFIKQLVREIHLITGCRVEGPARSRCDRHRPVGSRRPSWPRPGKAEISLVGRFPRQVHPAGKNQ